MKYSLPLFLILALTACTTLPLADNTLLNIKNLESFFAEDCRYSQNCLTAYLVQDQKQVQSMSIYTHSYSEDAFVFSDSIVFNKSGKPVMRFTNYGRTYLLYDTQGNNYLDVMISSNHYDTTYTLRKFDSFNRKKEEISYNKVRKEYGRLHIVTINPVSESELKMRYEVHYPDHTYQKLFPFETREITLTKLSDSTAQTHSVRTVYSDTTNSSDITQYKIQHNLLLPTDSRSVIDIRPDAPCFEISYNKCQTKRAFTYYSAAEPEVVSEFTVDQSMIKKLEADLKTLPVLAWENYKEAADSFSERKKLIELGVDMDSVQLKESTTLEAFTPPLWHLVTQAKGKLTGYTHECLVVGYNTPLKVENDFNKRCLAIYELDNGKYKLIKQTFGALYTFSDSGDDLLFDKYDENDFSIAIDNGDIAVDYQYMRGETSHIFSNQTGQWTLVYFSSGGRTCCSAESYSYNYLTKEYQYFKSSIEEEPAEGDTTYTVIQNRPVMYMDSLRVRGFDLD